MERKYVQNSFINKWPFQWGLPIVLMGGLLILKQYPAVIEQYYSTGLYGYIAIIQRSLTHIFSCSIGDILYIALFILALAIVIKKIVYIICNKPNRYWYLKGGKKLIQLLLWLYIVFMLFWGLNYNRQGLAVQLQLPTTTYTENELKEFTCILQERLNNARKALGDTTYIFATDNQQIQFCIQAYKSIEKKYSFLAYPIPSAKKSLLYHFVSSAGYSGYYNPFSGEAQINEDVPGFYKGFVIAHEIAHQIGYASESEASFSGYLACMHSNNKELRYSALYELFSAANNELFMVDAAAAFLNLKDLHPFVKYDRKKYRAYVLGKKNTFEPIIKNMYHQYLKANDQQKGIDSYNDIVAWVLAYEKNTKVGGGRF